MQINNLINSATKIYAITPDYDIDLNKIKQVLIQHNIKILQYRRKSNNVNLKFARAQKIQQLCLDLGVSFIINDDVLLCKELDADGVHLGRLDISLIEAKKILGNKIIGLSCYNNLDLALKYQEMGASYLAFGAIFASKTKPEATNCSLDLLSRAKKQLNLPIIAIGGINFNNKDIVLSSGADMVAMVSALWDL